MQASDLHPLDIALNEATLVGVDWDAGHRSFALTVAVLSLPEDGGDPPADPRLKLRLAPVGRIAASLRRLGAGDRRETVTLALDDLSAAVAQFGQLPMYGWHFFDAGDEAFNRWSALTSLDVVVGPERSHTIDLFQDGADQLTEPPAVSRSAFLDLRVWFDDLVVERKNGDRLQAVPLDVVAADGRRWWEGLYARDPRSLRSVASTPKERL